jgi:CHAD domain-containing protein
MVLTTHPAICSYGAEVLLRSLSAFHKEIPGVLRSRDIEYVHRLRVASRRLDTALVVFQICYPARRIKNWQKELSRTSRTLGRARDLDIQIDGVKKFLKTITSANQRPGIRRLLLRLRQKRGRVQAELVEMLSILEVKQPLASLESQSRALIDHHLAGETRTFEKVRQFAGEVILPVLVNFLSYEPFVDKVEAIEELHAMRIAAKKLRYTVECFSGIYPDQLSEHLSVLRTIQDQLGLIHDCDLWQASSNKIIEKERQRTEKYFGSDMAMKHLMPGFLAFFENRRQQRIDAYQTFTDNWHALERNGIWSKMRSLALPETRQDGSTR